MGPNDDAAIGDAMSDHPAQVNRDIEAGPLTEAQLLQSSVSPAVRIPPRRVPAIERETIALIDEVFRYHPPSQDQANKYDRIREEAKQLAYTIAELCPLSADRTHALRELRSVVMWANASIACDGVSTR